MAAVRNILTNAYESVLAREGQVGSGRITLNTSVVEGTEVRIVVEDNGVGISADDLREVRVFIAGRISKKGNGTGFGLPTAQRYVEAHGGTVAIESTENVGTTVSIILPLEGSSEAAK
jgi:signal transduction histidine kinase